MSNQKQNAKMIAKFKSIDKDGTGMISAAELK